MNLDDLLAPRRPVQAIDVLGKHHNAIEMLFQAGNRQMGSIRLGTTASLFDLDQIFPGDIRPNGKYLARKRIFNAHSLFRLITIVESANAAVGWQAGVR